MRLIPGLLILLISARSTSACTLKFTPGFQIPIGRVAAIDLAITHGAVASMRSIPIGWQVTIDNDPSWVTKVAGHAIVGAAFLNPSLLARWFSIEPEPGYKCSRLEADGLLRLKVTLYRDDRLHEVGIDRSFLRLTD